MSGLGRLGLSTLMERLVQEVGVNLRKYWALWLALAATLVAAAVGMFTGIARLGTRWEYPYDHSYLIVGMSAWLLARKLRTRSIDRIAPSMLGLVAVAVAVLFYAFSEILDISLGMQVALPLVLLSVVAALGGLRFARAAAIPILLLYFTIPIWDLTIPLLQRISLSAVSFALSWYGPAMYVEGNVITIPSGAFEVAEGCSGMRYFMVSLALATFIGLFWYERWRSRILLLCVAAFASMLTNWVRIYTLILIGDATNMQHYFIAKSHDGYGWFVYLACMAPVLWFARMLDAREPPPASRIATAAPASIAPAASFLIFGALASVFLASPALLRSEDNAATATHDVSLLPAGASDWTLAEPTPTWRPEFALPFLARREAFVSNDNIQVDVYVARYLRQRPGSKLIATHNSVSPGWQRLGSTRRLVSINAETRRVVETELGARSERRLLWQWYVIGGRPTHDRVQAKLFEALALLRGRRDGAVIAVSATCVAGCDDARAAMSKLVADAGPWLEAVANGAADASTSRTAE